MVQVSFNDHQLRRIVTAILTHLVIDYLQCDVTTHNTCMQCVLHVRASVMVVML